MKIWIGQITRSAALFTLAFSVWATEFQTGQAARAVLGQTSFSAREAGITPTALTISGGHLYAADASRHLLVFDLAQLPAAKDEPIERQGSVCAVCGLSPAAVLNQAVLPGVAAVTALGRTVVSADTANHRVLIWRDVNSPRAAKGPDVVLGRNGTDSSISAATLIEPVSVAFDGRRVFVGDAALHRVLIWNALPVSDGQPADVVLGQQNFTSINIGEAPAADSMNYPSALVSDGTNLFVADAVDHRILVFTAADTAMAGNAVLNSASLATGPVAPGTLITIMGSGLSDAAEPAPDEGESLPKALGGAEVFFNGVKVPLLSISPTQVRAQVPYNVEGLSASLYVRTTHQDGKVTTTNAAAVKILPGTPGLFAFGGTEPRSGMVLHASANSRGPGAPVTSEDPARPGELLIVWASGLGAINDGDAADQAIEGEPFHGPDAPVIHPVAAVVSGRPAEVVAASLPQASIGIYEVRILLPADLSSDSNTPLLISQEGHVSNTVTIPVIQ